MSTPALRVDKLRCTRWICLWWGKDRICYRCIECDCGSNEFRHKWHEYFVIEFDCYLYSITFARACDRNVGTRILVLCLYVDRNIARKTRISLPEINW